MGKTRVDCRLVPTRTARRRDRTPTVIRPSPYTRRRSARSLLFQPQIGALAGKPVHPLLREFVGCARAYADQA
ncbi:MAG: hypothetical protein WBP81_04325, partial [Solirubrobacteraceae bacterium]